MKNELEISRKIQVKKSPVEGYGVFATEDIPSGTTLEEVPFILMPKYTSLGKAFHDFSNSVGYCASKNKFYESLRQNLGFKEPEKYYFTWTPPQPELSGEKISFQVLPLGLGCIYNSSNTKNNAGWRVEKDTFTFYAVKDIKAGEEIKTFYGYFVDDACRNWNTDIVFYFGVDQLRDPAFEDVGDKTLELNPPRSKPCLSSIKFNNAEAFEQKKKDPGYHKVLALIEKYGNLKFESVSAVSPFGQEGLVRSNLSEVKTTKEIYEMLHGYKTSNAAKVKFVFSNFTNEEKDEVLIDR